MPLPGLLRPRDRPPHRFQVGKPCSALHIEGKQPDDDPKKDQAANYALRAECWVRQALERVLPHAAAETMLLFSERRRADYAPHIPKFGSHLTFEEAAQAFPGVAPAVWSSR